MAKAYAVMSKQPVGCTFLDWSIHWISGKTNYYNTYRGGIPLTSAPLQKINAHGHLKNHPSGFNSTVDQLQKLKKSGYPLTSIYPIPLHMDMAAKELDLSISGQLSVETTKRILDYVEEDWANVWNYCTQENVAKIIINVPDDLFSYWESGKRSLERKLLGLGRYSSEAEAYDDYIKAFYKDSTVAYQGNLSNLWDAREFFALNIRPPWHPSFRDTWKSIDLTHPHKLFDARILWHNGSFVVESVLEYLDLEIDLERFKTWEPVYKSWQGLQLEVLRFVYSVEHIVESIVHGYEFDLRPFKLSLYQEALIQHFLIFKHNLTIKNYNLSKFPDNTKDLHCLLEENFHTVEKIY